MNTPNQKQSEIEPTISELVLAHYWGKDWLETYGAYPEWNRYDDEQKEEVLELQALIDTACVEAREDGKDFQWRLDKTLAIERAEKILYDEPFEPPKEEQLRRWVIKMKKQLKASQEKSKP
jgi:hypothetical protein